MFGFFKLKKLQQELAIKEVELSLKAIEEARDAIIDKSEQGWVGLTSSNKSLDTFDQLTMIEQAQYLYYKNPYARSIIRNLVKFIAGQDIGFQPIERRQDILPDIINIWNDFRGRIFNSSRIKEIIIRSFRDGECFIRFFVRDNGLTDVRFIDPTEIDDPAGDYSYGIETEPDDIEKPLFYYRSISGKLIERIPAYQILHIKIGVDSNVKRGRSILEVVMPLLSSFDTWLKDRLILNKVRTAVALIKKVKSAHQIPSIVEKQKSSSLLHSGKQEMFKPGTIFTASDNIEYEMLSPNINAPDAKDDGRNILLAISAGSGLAEYMVTADASNANFSSTMVAESPAVREFQDWQNFFSYPFKQIFKQVITNAITFGLLPADTSTDCEIQYPPLIHRNLKEETDALVLHNQFGLASKETVSEKLGYDFYLEQEKIKNESNNNL